MYVCCCFVYNSEAFFAAVPEVFRKAWYIKPEHDDTSGVFFCTKLAQNGFYEKDCPTNLANVNSRHAKLLLSEKWFKPTPMHAGGDRIAKDRDLHLPPKSIGLFGQVFKLRLDGQMLHEMRETASTDQFAMEDSRLDFHLEIAGDVSSEAFRPCSPPVEEFDDGDSKDDGEMDVWDI